VAVLDAAVIAELRELADGNEAFVQEVLTAYLEQANEIVAAMRASLRANDTRSFRLGAHALGGSSLQVGAARVARICHAIQSSEDDAPAPLAADLETLESELCRVNASVERAEDMHSEALEGR
jgi:HPt (histidine-containing phosphotransfer) domain-containing protein